MLTGCKVLGAGRNAGVVLSAAGVLVAGWSCWVLGPERVLGAGCCRGSWC